MAEQYAPRPQVRDHPGQLGSTSEVSRDQLIQIHADAQLFFADLVHKSWVPGYLRSRGFVPTTVTTWAIGYAPGGGSALLNHLLGRGHPLELIQESGLTTTTSDGRLIDRFRNRLMLPTTDESGTIIAFLGRAAPNANVPKMLNSPTTDLYQKGKSLFGLSQGRKRLLAGAQPVLVEGPMDAIAVSIDPRYVGLAVCGSTLTDDQVRLLSRTTPIRDLGVITAFDDDKAGWKATRTAYEKLTLITNHTYAVQLPSGSDPADVLHRWGPDGLFSAFDQPAPLSDLVISKMLDELLNGPNSTRVLNHIETRYRLLRHITDFLRGHPPSDVHRQIARIATRLDAPVTEVMSAFVGEPEEEIALARMTFPAPAEELIRPTKALPLLQGPNYSKAVTADRITGFER